MELLQNQQTEKLIEEMLEFLDSTSEEEDDTQKIILKEEDQQQSLQQELEDENESSTDYQGDEDELEEEENLNAPLDESRKERKSNTSLVTGIKKLKQQSSIWDIKEIASPQKKSLSSQTNVTITEPIWRQCLLNKGADVTGENSDDTAEFEENEWHNKLELNCRRSTNNAYVQEVQRAIYGDTSGHPASGSKDYYHAAQNYAIYGKDFLDFPENLLPLINDKAPSTNENTNFSTNFGNGLYPTPTSIPTTSCESNSAGLGLNNLGKPTTTSSSTTCSSGNSSTPAAAAAAAAVSSAAYYQMCNSIQQPARATANAAAGNTAATAYGMFLGNKVTYVAAAPTAPPLVYNQHTSSTTNFISNSLANVALASSPAVLYSNPMFTTTTQQYLNTFFKETQYLSTAGGASSSQGTAIGTTTGIYERLVYAQMLQQQIYHQTQQQAAAVAAMFQHKQRASAAAAAASVRASTSVSTNLSNSNNGNNTVQVAAIGTTSNLCARQATMTVSNSPDLLLIKQQTNSTNPSAIPANGTEDSANAITD